MALLGRVDPHVMPTHVAVIMDGNRRWARQHRLPSIMGHRAGVRSFRELVRACSDLGVRVLTAYAFSLENWKRSQAEVSILMHLFEHYCRTDRREMLANGVRFRVLGEVELLPARVQAEFARTAEATAHNDKVILNLAVNYGSRGELVRAAKRLAQAVRDGQLSLDDLDESAIEANLFTQGLPDPDLLIRTSGELRVSNFLLWQMAYTEFAFTARYWPDFTRSDLLQAILDYQSRERRFGGGSHPEPSSSGVALPPQVAPRRVLSPAPHGSVEVSR
jgi:undecaprenyl diphosphate synthase